MKSSVSQELETFLVRKFTHAIGSWPQERVQDIYALSLYRDDNNVPYRPSVYLVYNTRQQARTRQPAHPDSLEVRWNLAYWQHDDWVGIEDCRSTQGRNLDAEGTRVLEAWLEAARREYGDDTDAIVSAFAALCVRVARRLHETGVIRRVFGGDVPIIMHDDNWDDAMDRNTVAANPSGVAQEFLDAAIF